MQDFFNWFQTGAIDHSRPWLILGKGPSFAWRGQYDVDSFNTLGLNHVCREQGVTLAHLIDLEVVGACGEALIEKAKYVVMPWRPHIRVDSPLARAMKQTFRVSTENLEALARQHPLLQQIDREGRLLYYNLSTAGEPQGDSPVVAVRCFSAEAALNLLAAAGVRRVRSLGIDGGQSYSTEFGDLRDQTLLANQRSSFDAQFAEIARTIMTTGIDYAPLDVESPIRIYVATTEAQMLSVKVLEYSIRKYASMTVEVFPLHLAGVDIRTPRDLENRPRTPFSFQRFLIPALAGYRGRAIYLDSDMQVFRDIRELWALPFQGAELLAAQERGATERKPQFSVMLLNCDALRWDIDQIVTSLDDGRLAYGELMDDMKIAGSIRADIDPRWNSLERFEPGGTALLHYTDMQTQPWVSTRNPLGYLWIRDLFEAVDRGLIPTAYVADHVQRGYVRPSLLEQLERRIEDPLLLPKRAKAQDERFVAPFRSIHGHSGSPWRSSAMFARAAVRNMYQRSPLYRLHRRVRNRLSM